MRSNGIIRRNTREGLAWSTSKMNEWMNATKGTILWRLLLNICTFVCAVVHSLHIICIYNSHRISLEWQIIVLSRMRWTHDIKYAKFSNLFLFPVFRSNVSDARASCNGLWTPPAFVTCETPISIWLVDQHTDTFDLNTFESGAYVVSVMNEGRNHFCFIFLTPQFSIDDWNDVEWNRFSVSNFETLLSSFGQTILITFGGTAFGQPFQLTTEAFWNEHCTANSVNDFNQTDFVCPQRSPSSVLFVLSSSSSSFTFSLLLLLSSFRLYQLRLCETSHVKSLQLDRCTTTIHIR